MTTFAKKGLEIPVSDSQDLVAFLANGARARKDWAIGAESEKLVVDQSTGEAPSFERIEELLRRLEQNPNWEGVREDGRLIALQGPSSSITLEPGGQLELSGELCGDIHCCYADFVLHHCAVSREAEKLGLVFLGLGVHPFTPLDGIPWVPKARYRVMGPYMTRTGELGQAMMKQSAGLQVNIDFENEADWLAKLRLALLLSPVFYALFANSPLCEGKPTGFLSTRGEIWARTDPDRTGLLPTLMEEGANYETYVDYALDVPMYFIMRDGHYVNLTHTRFTFRDYLRQGHRGWRATLSDWDLHLSTLFPEARLRPQIELRSADSLPPSMTMGVAALVKGIMYDQTALAAAASLLTREVCPDLARVFRQSWRLGLNTPLVECSMRDLCADLLEISRQGLARQKAINERGMDETIYLKDIMDLVEGGVTLAEKLLNRWQGSRIEKVALLREHCGFSPELGCRDN